MAMDTGAIITTCVLVVVFIFSLAGQSIITYVLTTKNRAKLSLPIYRFLLNINIASLVGLLTLPFHVIEEVATSWSLGGLVCKLIEFFEHSTLGIVLITHVLIALDRYYLVVKATTANLSVQKSNLLILGTWVLAIVVFCPDLYVYDAFKFDDHMSCTSNPDRLGKVSIALRVFKVAVLFAVPLVVIAVTNFRVVKNLRNRIKPKAPQTVGMDNSAEQPANINRQSSLAKATIRTTNMTVCLAVVFLIGSTPSFVICQTYASSEFIEESHRQTTAYEVATMTMFLSAALMPVVFAIFDKNVKDVTKYLFCGKRNQVHVHEDQNRSAEE